jgi:sRNA-binding carbon storage regulator CsrA
MPRRRNEMLVVRAAITVATITVKATTARLAAT